MDVKMPKLDISAAERLSKNHIAPCGSSHGVQPEGARGARERGGRPAYVVKPFTPNDRCPRSRSP